jgi:hypothetical protein
MKYFLILKNPETQAEESRVEYTSLLQISKDLKTTYCSCYNNFLSHENPETKPAKKLSQVKFNKKFKIISL